MKLDDLTEIISCEITERLLQHPAYLIVHRPSDGEQQITVANKDGKVFSVLISELRE